MKLNLLYLTFGPNTANHFQANLSILSFLKRKDQISKIFIVTDQPAYYKRFGAYIEIVHVDDETLKLWKGEFDFFWRIKIKAIEMIASRYPNQPIAYLDSDTFLYHNLDYILDALKDGKAFMHDNEGSLSSLKTKTEKKMWRQVRAKEFGGISINQSHEMWNAGIVMLPPQKQDETVQLALNICDDMCRAGVTRRLIEQFALAVALQLNYKLESSQDYIAHYWGNKREWHIYMHDLFARLHITNFNLEEEIETISLEEFSKIPVRIYRSSAHRKIVRFIDKLFPQRSMGFIKTYHSN